MSLQLGHRGPAAARGYPSNTGHFSARHRSPYANDCVDSDHGEPSASERMANDSAAHHAPYKEEYPLHHLPIPDTRSPEAVRAYNRIVEYGQKSWVDTGVADRRALFEMLPRAALTQSARHTLSAHYLGRARFADSWPAAFILAAVYEGTDKFEGSKRMRTMLARWPGIDPKMPDPHKLRMRDAIHKYDGDVEAARRLPPRARDARISELDAAFGMVDAQRRRKDGLLPRGEQSEPIVPPRIKHLVDDARDKATTGRPLKLEDEDDAPSALWRTGAATSEPRRAQGAAAVRTPGPGGTGRPKETEPINGRKATSHSYQSLFTATPQDHQSIFARTLQAQQQTAMGTPTRSEKRKHQGEPAGRPSKRPRCERVQQGHATPDRRASSQQMSSQTSGTNSSPSSMGDMYQSRVEDMTREQFDRQMALLRDRFDRSRGQEDELSRANREVAEAHAEGRRLAATIRGINERTNAAILNCILEGDRAKQPFIKEIKNQEAVVSKAEAAMAACIARQGQETRQESRQESDTMVDQDSSEAARAVEGSGHGPSSSSPRYSYGESTAIRPLNGLTPVSSLKPAPSITGASGSQLTGSGESDTDESMW